MDANLAVGASFLADLLSQVGGDEALAGAAYLGQNAVIGKTPDQLKGAYRKRYEPYQKLLNAFYSFDNCVQRAMISTIM